MMDIPKNLHSIKQQVHEYERRYGRAQDSVHLLAVSKGQSIAKIQLAVVAGQRSFGENYLQEALPKITSLAAEQLEWHFIGAIQANKTHKIAEHFHWVHSVADPKIAQRLAEQRPDNLSPLNICLQVNISHETNKSGIEVQKLAELVSCCAELPQLKLRGLMAIPAPTAEFARQRAQFHELHTLFEQIREQGFLVDTLSMGMSQDMEAAIAEGATMVRIGTAIFGPRE